MKKYELVIDGKKYDVEVDLSGSSPSVLVNGKKIDVTIGSSDIAEKPRIERKKSKKSSGDKNDTVVETSDDPGDLKALMPGKVTQVLVSGGQKVKVGEPVLLMESMKMEQTIVATKDGDISEILVSEGDTVEVGKIMIKIN